MVPLSHAHVKARTTGTSLMGGTHEMNGLASLMGSRASRATCRPLLAPQSAGHKQPRSGKQAGRGGCQTRLLPLLSNFSRTVLCFGGMHATCQHGYTSGPHAPTLLRRESHAGTIRAAGVGVLCRHSILKRTSVSMALNGCAVSVGAASILHARQGWAAYCRRHP